MTIPRGFCRCGCGLPTPLARRTDKQRGLVKGEPCNYLRGHSMRANPPYTVDPVTGCWLWAQWTCEEGYPRIWIGNRRTGAHRVYYERFKGEIPAGFQVDHLCRDRACVNPDHLEAVSPAVNTRRGLKGRLKPPQVQEILSSELGSRALAEKFGVGKTTVRQVRQRFRGREADALAVHSVDRLERAELLIAEAVELLGDGAWVEAARDFLAVAPVEEGT